ICRFCWHHIQENLNGLCPACRRVYSEQTIEFKPISAEDDEQKTSVQHESGSKKPGLRDWTEPEDCE
ncbi:30714_t:CDS:2, partial [Racocetra persica]